MDDGEDEVDDDLMTDRQAILYYNFVFMAKRGRELTKESALVSPARRRISEFPGSRGGQLVGGGLTFV